MSGGLPVLGALAAAVVALQSRRLLERIPRDPKTSVACGVAAAALVTLGRAAVGADLDPYLLALSGAATWAALEAARAQASAGLDVLLLVAIWVPLDLRVVYDIFPLDHDFAYAFSALFAAALATLALGRMRAPPLVAVRLAPRARDVPVVLGCLLGFAAIALPVGFATGFLAWAPPPHLSLAHAGALSGGYLLTVAIPEETLFRGVLQSSLERVTRRPKMSLVLASAAFGLTHWNNADGLQEKIIYCALAAVAGLFYGSAYRLSGAILPAAVVHALVDSVWRLVLTKP